MKIYLDKELLNDYGEKVYRLSGSVPKEQELFYKEFESSEAYEICMFMGIKNNGKYYFFATSRNGSWTGYEVKKELLEKLRKENIDMVIKEFHRIND